MALGDNKMVFDSDWADINYYAENVTPDLVYTLMENGFYEVGKQEDTQQVPAR